MEAHQTSACTQLSGSGVMLILAVNDSFKRMIAAAGGVATVVAPMNMYASCD
jgi:hypothetical protein